MVNQPYFFTRVNKKYIRINFAEIRYMESIGNYIKIVTDARSFLTPMTIKQLEKALPPGLFCRVNRGCIVSIDRIVCFDRDGLVLHPNIRIPFSDRYRKDLEAKVNIISYDLPDGKSQAVPDEEEAE